MTKMHVVAAVEPTSGASPAELMRMAALAPAAERTRVVIADYLPAFLALKEKGYTNEAAAAMMVEMGCPFTPLSIVQRYRESRRGGRK
jgi:hypothetical protein